MKVSDVPVYNNGLGKLPFLRYDFVLYLSCEFNCFSWIFIERFPWGWGRPIRVCLQVFAAYSSTFHACHPWKWTFGPEFSSKRGGVISWCLFPSLASRMIFARKTIFFFIADGALVWPFLWIILRYYAVTIKSMIPPPFITKNLGVYYPMITLYSGSTTL